MAAHGVERCCASVVLCGAILLVQFNFGEFWWYLSMLWINHSTLPHTSHIINLN